MSEESKDVPVEQDPRETEPVEATRESTMRLRRQRPREKFALPDGTFLWVCGLFPMEWEDWRNACIKRKDRDGVERMDDPLADAKLIVRCVRDSAGKCVYGERDLTLIIEWPQLVTVPLVSLCLKLNAFNGSADEGILKNFGMTLAGGSSSA
jgi:hypothetical protein